MNGNKAIYGYTNCAFYNRRPEGDTTWFATREARDAAARPWRRLPRRAVRVRRHPRDEQQREVHRARSLVQTRLSAPARRSPNERASTGAARAHAAATGEATRPSSRLSE